MRLMMELQSRSCACKGIRSCLLCEKSEQTGATAAASRFRDPSTSTTTFYQCHYCGNILREDETVPDLEAKPLLKCITGNCGLELKTIKTKKEGVELDDFSAVPEGVTVIKEFVSREKEREIVLEIDGNQWAESQSGRRKQDYGPKVNFKRQKVKLGSFNGLPPFSEELMKRMQSEVAELRGFTPVELCNLDYSPERGSAIDPHMDDNWIWGERLVTLNLLSSTYLTFSNSSTQSLSSDSHTPAIKVCVPLPQRSLVIVQGHSRYQWQHSIHREHICSRRLATTLRELTVDFMPGGKFYETTGRDILEAASNYQGSPINFRI